MNEAYGAVVRLNETVKSVVRDSGRLYLTSLNAMFMAKQVGVQAAGFRHVTAELRRFSHGMNARMEALRRSIYVLLSQVSELRKLERAAGYLREARRDGERRRTTYQVAELGRRAEERRARLAGELTANRIKFLREMELALRLCAMGETLAVLAKVEAVATNDQESTNKLTYIAGEVDATVAGIKTALGNALSELTHYGEKVA